MTKLFTPVNNKYYNLGFEGDTGVFAESAARSRSKSRKQQQIQAEKLVLPPRTPLQRGETVNQHISPLLQQSISTSPLQPNVQGVAQLFNSWQRAEQAKIARQKFDTPGSLSIYGDPSYAIAESVFGRGKKIYQDNTPLKEVYHVYQQPQIDIKEFQNRQENSYLQQNGIRSNRQLFLRPLNQNDRVHIGRQIDRQLQTKAELENFNKKQRDPTSLAANLPVDDMPKKPRFPNSGQFPNTQRAAAKDGEKRMNFYRQEQKQELIWHAKKVKGRYGRPSYQKYE